MTSQNEGFTLLEVAIAVALLATLLTSLFAVGLETSKFLSDTDTDFAVQEQAQRAYDGIARELRKSGWNNLSGTDFPLVLDDGANGQKVHFRLPQDLDGNGAAFDETTGDVEWSPEIFSARKMDGTDDLWFWRSSDGVTHSSDHRIARNILSVNFDTYVQDNALALDEVRVVVVAQKFTRDGNPITHTVSGSIHMRN